MYLLAVSRAIVPAAKYADAWSFSCAALVIEGFAKPGMKPGPGGASGFVNGSAASQSWNAASYSGVKRAASMDASFASPAAWACSHAVKKPESATSCCPPSVEAASASKRVVEASP